MTTIGPNLRIDDSRGGTDSIPAYSQMQPGASGVIPNLPGGTYALLLQMQDPSNPATVVVTNTDGSTQTFNKHGVYLYTVGGGIANTASISFTSTGGGGLDRIALYRQVSGGQAPQMTAAF